MIQEGSLIGLGAERASEYCIYNQWCGGWGWGNEMKIPGMLMLLFKYKVMFTIIDLILFNSTNYVRYI